MNTKTMPDLPIDGDHVSFTPWRPHSKKKIMFDSFCTTGLALEGYMLSNSDSVLSLICASISIGFGIKLWRNNRLAKKHERMLQNTIASYLMELNIEDDQYIEHVITSEYYLSRVDVREWLAKIIKTGEHKLYLNKKGYPEHHFKWMFPENVTEILIALSSAIVQTALKESATGGSFFLGFNSLEGPKKYIKNNEGKIIGFEMIIQETGAEEFSELLTDYTMGNIDFFLKTWDLNIEHKTQIVENPVQTDAQTEIVLKIPHEGKWILHDGAGILYINANKAGKYLVTLWNNTLDKHGETLVHHSLESVNKTWGHLVSHAYTG